MVSILTGIGAGAGAAYLLDPDHGRRRRALLRDQAVHAARKTGEAVGATARDVTHRAQGVGARARHLLQAEQTADEQLAARVRSQLGRVCSHPGAVEVEAREGRVVLSGPILAKELDDVVAAVRTVGGVEDVENRLEPHASAEGVPALQGEGRVPGPGSWSPTARLVAGLAGGGLVASALAQRSRLAGVVSGAGGAVLLLRAATNLEMKRLFGVGAGRRAVDVQKTLHIDAPVGQVYEFWRHYHENFPRFLSNIREIRPTAVPGQSHWVISGPGGAPVEFDAVITREIPNELLAWKTVEGAPVGHAGVARFDATSEGSTRVHLRMSYSPPAGAVGHGVAAILGFDPKTKLNADLLRMKTLLETGRPPHDAETPRSPGRP